MKRRWQLTLITLIAVGLFVSLRSLPDTECAFLHYQPAEVTIDGIEFCGDDAPTFLDLERIRFPVQMELSLPETIQAGESVFAALSLKNSSGATIQPHELAITHTEPLHLMVVDPSLEDYHHLHPEPLGPAGEWGFEFTPRKSGSYRAFAEFVPARTKQKVTATGQILVEPRMVGGLQADSVLPSARLETLPRQLSTASESSLTLRFEEALTLEPVMGALGHMVAFDESLSGYAHLHPKYTGRERQPQPELEFAFNTDKPGNYRLWAQVKVDGEERFLPFDIVVN